MEISTVKEFEETIRTPHTECGGYPKFWITADGEVLSFEAVTEERNAIEEAIEEGDKFGGWCVVACDINFDNPDLYCDYTGERIESAYED